MLMIQQAKVVTSMVVKATDKLWWKRIAEPIAAMVLPNNET
jgi:hypothetical protein